MTFKQMTFARFSELAKHSNRVAVYREIMADRLTPIGVAEQLQAEMRQGTILESGSQHNDDSRYSYLAFGLMAQLTAFGHEIKQRIGNKTVEIQADPFQVLRQMQQEFLCEQPSHDLLRLHGSVGFVTYDAVRLREAIPDRHAASQHMPDILFNFYDTTLIFDHVQHTLLLAKTVELNGDLEQIYAAAMDDLQSIINKISQVLTKESAEKLEKKCCTNSASRCQRCRFHSINYTSKTPHQRG